MRQGYFITGTDTGAGKTWATVALMRYCANRGKSVAGLKPVASGCRFKDSKLVNDDALLLQQNASVKLPYDWVNPYAFEFPVSPHIAGELNPVKFQPILELFENVKKKAEIIFVEGAGGWYSPLNASQDNSDLALALGLPVIVVVAIKLGCINHARLTLDAVRQKGVECTGWIAVHLDNRQLAPERMVASLQERLDVPLLGELPYIKSVDNDRFADAANWMELDKQALFI